jgi:hypothetical protein
MAVQYNPGIVTDGLRFYFDASNKKSYSGIGLTASNLITNTNLMSFVNGVTFSNLFPNSLSFDGVDDYINTEEIYSFDRNKPFTFIAWVNPNTLANPVILNNEINSFGYSFSLLNNSPSIALRTTSVNRIQVLGSVSFTLGNWAQLAAIYNGGACASGISLYTNVIGHTSPTIFGDNLGASFDSNLSPYIGGRRAGGAAFPGLIGSVSIYNRALSPQEIQQNFNALRGRFGI